MRDLLFRDARKCNVLEDTKLKKNYYHILVLIHWYLIYSSHKYDLYTVASDRMFILILI
jgi:hypothetical protein